MNQKTKLDVVIDCFLNGMETGCGFLLHKLLKKDLLDLLEKYNLPADTTNIALNSHFELSQEVRDAIVADLKDILEGGESDILTTEQEKELVKNVKNILLKD